MVKQRINLKDVDISVNGQILGGCEELSVTITRDNEEAYSGGSYKPDEIVDGKIHIAGSLTRAFIDVDLLNEIMPNQALQPEFTLSGTITSGKSPARNMKIFGAKFDSVDISSFTLDGYARNVMPFKARDWRFD